MNYACAFTAMAHIEPPNYEEVMKSDDAKAWKKAMDEEYNSLIENNTWELVDRPKDRPVIPVRWLYRIKQDENGRITRYKARFVAKGYAQMYGIDYDETFSPVFKLSSLRIILSIGASLDLEIEQMDMITAFLNGDVDKEIYVEQPEGYKKNNKVCKLRWSLYGLKQSPHLWNKKIDGYLRKIRFKRCINDPCIYTMTGNEMVIIGIWVDDVIIIANKQMIQQVKEKLAKEFKMTDQGKISYILGMSIT